MSPGLRSTPLQKSRGDKLTMLQPRNWPSTKRGSTSTRWRKSGKPRSISALTSSRKRAPCGGRAASGFCALGAWAVALGALGGASGDPPQPSNNPSKSRLEPRMVPGIWRKPRRKAKKSGFGWKWQPLKVARRRGKHGFEDPGRDLADFTNARHVEHAVLGHELLGPSVDRGQSGLKLASVEHLFDPAARSTPLFGDLRWDVDHDRDIGTQGLGVELTDPGDRVRAARCGDRLIRQAGKVIAVTDHDR